MSAWHCSTRLPRHRHGPLLAASLRCGNVSRARFWCPRPTERLRRGRSPVCCATAAFAVADALEGAEEQLTSLDAQAGDGDLGASMVRGAVAIRAMADSAWATPEMALAGLGNALRRAIAGSSGPFYATALLRAARELRGLPQPDADAWRAAFAQAVAAVAEIGGAQTGDRTMVDALQPASDVLASAAGRSPAEAWAQAVDAAVQGAERTAGMMPKLGRASYLGDRVLGVPDGGAVAVTVWMKALLPFIR